MENFERIAALMTEEDREEYRRIWAPVTVASAPCSAFCTLSVLNSGEIRCYGDRTGLSGHAADRECIYISSLDGGLSWKTHITDEKVLGPSVRSPWSGRRIAVEVLKIENYTMAGILPPMNIRISEEDEGTSSYRVVNLPYRLYPNKPPLPLRSVKRWLIFGEYDGRSAVYLSDDDGESWRFVRVPDAEKFKVAPPHLSPRWENPGREPTVTELSDGTLMMIVRTSQDYHYVSWSHDHGDSWSVPAPTSFHSTLTNPELLRLHDGRTVFFYNNTRPLPEFDKTKVFPPLNEREISGDDEDVFTNRDTNCIAVSEDDGKTWKGFRELFLNPLRNTCDFRTSGGTVQMLDKSVHQFQAIELPYNKILVHVGQHERLTRLMIFDIGWLYETARRETFRAGLDAVDTHVYVKSVSGTARGGNPDGSVDIPGHCAWNRTNGALLIPDPCGDHSEVLLLRNVPDDPMLYSGYQGAVWNFPALHQGSAEIRLMIRGKGIRVALLDHWMNPTDATVPLYASFLYELTDQISRNDWHDLSIRFDTDRGISTLFCDGEPVLEAPMRADAPNGVCYLHLQTLSDAGDPDGTIVKRFETHL